MQTRTTYRRAADGGEEQFISIDDRLPFQRRHLAGDLGPRLRTARGVAGLTRREVGSLAQMAPRTIARIERGEQRPLWPSLERICGVLGISAHSVAGDRWSTDAVEQPYDPVAVPGIGVRRLRLDRGLTLRQVADRVGVSVSSLSRFERGLTVSRALSSRDGPSSFAYLDQDVVLSSDLLAQVLGCVDAEDLRAACGSGPD